MTPSYSSDHIDSRKWSFVQKFRCGLVVLFMTFLVFLVVSLAIGIISNLHWHYADLDISTKDFGSPSDLGSFELSTCFSTLKNMHNELIERVQKAFWSVEDRDTALAGWKTWSRNFNKRFEKLGVQCMLTNYQYNKQHKALGLLAGIYRNLEYFHKRHTRLVRRYITENAESLRQLRELFHRAQQEVETLEGKPVGTESFTQ